MGVWNSLVVLSLVAAAAQSSPLPDEYDIPDVGNNRRAQYYVLHDDGSFKYGYDTGADAFESLKTNAAGEAQGKFGYKDEDGQQYNIEYTSGTGGFVAKGAHIPQVHPDVAAAFEAARSAAPFVDPLAGTEGDRSYNFNFAGDEHSRNEVSDSDGTVRGSYSYIDEFGRTRTYTYRAGKGIGFVIEGDDIPQPVQPLPTHVTTTQFGAPQGAATAAQRAATHRSAGATPGLSAKKTSFASHSAAASRPAAAVSSSATQRKASHSSASSSHKIPKPAATYFPPTQTASVAPAVQSTQSSSSASNRAAQKSQSGIRPSTRQFEAANTRSSQSPSGSYSFAYETSSHAREESGDDDNNVRGKFRFVADDDGEDRSVTYEAGSSTGFIAEGAHLPIGPIVPGAPTGQVTGRIVPVKEVTFIDPLADSDSDASYNFGFDSDTYSRSETADEDGNVVGTYSVLGDDNILRTYRFRAGKGIGFETEEVSATPGQRRASSSITSTSSQTQTKLSAPTGHRSTLGSVSHSSPASVVPSVTLNAPVSAHSSRTSAGAGHAGVATSSGTRSSFSSSAGVRSSVRRTSVKSSSDEVFPGFSLRQYDPTEGRGKYGYVLKFDD
ncbi:mucin-22 isoform X3 [Hyalella azteca]|uniref:Mucin-22 isoform X3 n=1 Tax=Hyalella azteca TaxID=294128 RepID=A0A8B7NCB7_HYAAZ|nr:mucin-22 isoform X3 [Hyalella azteca]